MRFARRVPLRALSVASIAALLAMPRVAHAQTYTVSIVSSGFSDGTKPIVTGVVNARVPFATQELTLEIEPKPPTGTSVRWTSPDGMNEIGQLFHAADSSASSYDATVADAVGIFENDGMHGSSTIVADIGAPVNARATIAVYDGAGIGFGCYGFLALGPSVRFADGTPQRTTLADADVAVVGTGRFEGTGPGYGCWGENFEPNATAIRLIFNHGGRLGNEPSGPFVHELAYEDVDRVGELDVLAGDGGTYRLHIRGGAGTYFTGWAERLPR